MYLMAAAILDLSTTGSCSDLDFLAYSRIGAGVKLIKNGSIAITLGGE